MQVPYNKSITLQSAAVATGDGTVMEVGDLCTVGFQVSGTFAATVTFEGNVDLTNWVSVQVTNVATGAISTTATAAGVFVANVAGLRQVRARVTWTSGTSVTVAAFGTAASLAAPLADDTLGSNSGVDIGDVDVTTLPDAIQGPANVSIDSYSTAVVSLTASTTNQVLVVAPGASKQIWVYAVFMMADTAAGTVVFQDEDDTALSGTMAVSDEGGWVLPHSGNFAMPWIKCTTAKALEADTGACTIGGILCYGIASV